MRIKKINPNVFPALIVSLLFFTSFAISEHLFNGILIAWELWLYGVVAFIFLYGGLNIAFKSKKLHISYNFVDILLIIFYLWCFFSAYNTSKIPYYLNHKLQIYTVCIVIYLFTKKIISKENIKIEGKRPIVLPVIILSLLLSGLVQAVYGLLQLYGVLRSYHGGFKITGSFYNPAPYALFLATIFSLAFGIYFLYGKEQKSVDLKLMFGSKSTANYLNLFYILKYLALTTLIVILLVLPATMIRASWIGVIIGSVTVLLIAYKQKIIKRPHWLKGVLKSYLLIIIAILIVGAATIFLFKLKEGSSHGRLLIWEVTLNKIKEKPLVGHGLGGFEAQYNTWQAEYFQKHPNEINSEQGWVAGSTSYCFNEYMEMASETGIIGLTLFVLSLLVLLFPIKKKDKEEQIKSNETFLTNYWEKPSIFFYPPVVSLLAMATVSFPFSLYNIPLLVIFIVFIGIISASNEMKFSKDSSLFIPLFARYIIAAIFLACFIGIVKNQYKKILAYRNWQEASFAYEAGYYPEANKLFKNTLPQMKYNGLYMDHYGKSLQIAENNRDAIKILKQASYYISDYNLCCTIGNAYKAEKLYTQAEDAYIRASYMFPSKIYPHYLLAKLYFEKKEYGKAKDKANEVLEKKAKIRTMVEEQIKTEMKKIIKQVDLNE